MFSCFLRDRWRDQRGDGGGSFIVFDAGGFADF